MSQVRAGHEIESEAGICKGEKGRLRENVSYLEMCPVDRLAESFSAIPAFLSTKGNGECTFNRVYVPCIYLHAR